MRWIRESVHGSFVGSAQLTDPLIGVAGRKARARAADWALRAHQSRPVRRSPPAIRLVALALAAHSVPERAGGITEIGQLTRASGLTVSELLHAVDLLSAAGTIDRWSLDPATDDLTWAMNHLSPPYHDQGG
ncbi:hypothetical protein ABZ318_15595 [Streptomyces sp. NPDC006197]|uniref:hypothetical protein n=1 Tax=Streptomyces sp. NPDC006197 TaxID=3156685 RepID=UPI0033A3F449